MMLDPWTSKGIRAAIERDRPAITDLLSRAGMLRGAEEAELVERAHALAEVILVASNPDHDVLGTMVLLRRSCSELWGADFAVDRDRASVAATGVALWGAAVSYAADRGFHFISTKPRGGDGRVAKLYRLMGVLDRGRDGEMRSPLPVCVKLWRLAGDRGVMPPRYQHTEGSTRFFGRETVVTIGREAATCVDSSGAIRAEAVLASPSADVDSCCSALGIEGATGRLSLRETTIAPPLWSNMSSHGLRLPVDEAAPWRRDPQQRMRWCATREGARNGAVAIEHAPDADRLSFSTSGGARHLRLVLETSRAVEFDVTGGHIEPYRYSFDQRARSCEVTAVEDRTRIVVHFDASPQLVLTVRGRT